jgi:heptosyltransferase-2
MSVDRTGSWLRVTSAEEAEIDALLGRLDLASASAHRDHARCVFRLVKMWPQRALAADAILDRHGGAACVFPGPGEEEAAERVAKRMRGRVAVAPVVGLGALKAAIRRSTLLLTNDAGVRHFAVALRVPHVVVMGPTDPRYTDMNLAHAAVLRREVPCGPCHLKVCPLDHRCMTGITVSDVVAAAGALLAKGTQ